MSSFTTAVTGCSAGESSELIHRLKRGAESPVDETTGESTPPTAKEVIELLERYAFTARNWEDLSDRRRSAVLQRIEAAKVDIEGGGELPDRQTFNAWVLLPMR